MSSLSLMEHQEKNILTTCFQYLCQIGVEDIDPSNCSEVLECAALLLSESPESEMSFLRCIMPRC